MNRNEKCDAYTRELRMIADRLVKEGETALPDLIEYEERTRGWRVGGTFHLAAYPDRRMGNYSSLFLPVVHTGFVVYTLVEFVAYNRPNDAALVNKILETFPTLRNGIFVLFLNTRNELNITNASTETYRTMMRHGWCVPPSTTQNEIIPFRVSHYLRDILERRPDFFAVCLEFDAFRKVDRRSLLFEMIELYHPSLFRWFIKYDEKMMMVVCEVWDRDRAVGYYAEDELHENVIEFRARLCDLKAASVLLCAEGGECLIQFKNTFLLNEPKKNQSR